MHFVYLGEHSVLHMLNKQISSITVKIHDPQRPLITNGATKIFRYVLAMFPNLNCFRFETSIYCEPVSWNHLAQAICSSNLLQLHIHLENFDDCIHLLDGRFNQLHTLCITLSTIHSDQTIDNEVN
jgi:hypothetical protein